MIKTGKRIVLKRLYSEVFKKRMVHLFESGQRTVLELSKEHDFSQQALYKWVYRYSMYNKKGVQIVEMNDSQTSKVKQLEHQVKELEQAIGRKQIRIDYLEKLFELAQEHYGIDLKKNSTTPPCGGSKPTDQKWSTV